MESSRKVRVINRKGWKVTVIGEKQSLSARMYPNQTKNLSDFEKSNRFLYEKNKYSGADLQFFGCFGWHVVVITGNSFAVGLSFFFRFHFRSFRFGNSFGFGSSLFGCCSYCFG